MRLVEIDSLRLHEEIQPKLLDQLIKALEQDKVLNHPIIVDRGTLTVLDGHHRTEALRELGYIYIPVCALDYMNPKILVKSWYRTINSVGSEKINLPENLDKRFTESRVDDKTPASGKVLVLLTREKSFILNGSFESLEEV